LPSHAGRLGAHRSVIPSFLRSPPGFGHNRESPLLLSFPSPSLSGDTMLSKRFGRTFALVIPATFLVLLASPRRVSSDEATDEREPAESATSEELAVEQG